MTEVEGDGQIRRDERREEQEFWHLGRILRADVGLKESSRSDENEEWGCPLTISIELAWLPLRLKVHT